MCEMPTLKHWWWYLCFQRRKQESVWLFQKWGLDLITSISPLPPRPYMHVSWGLQGFLGAASGKEDAHPQIRQLLKGLLRCIHSAMSCFPRGERWGARHRSLCRLVGHRGGRLILCWQGAGKGSNPTVSLLWGLSTAVLTSVTPE